LRDLTLLILITAGTILIIVFYEDTRIREDISHANIDRVTANAIEKFNEFYTPVENSITIARKWGESGLLDIAQTADLRSKFIPIIAQIPQISAFSIANALGDEFFLMQDYKLWLTRQISAGAIDNKVVCQHWDENGNAVEKWYEESSYDPRSRPWFSGAVDISTNGEIYWTEPYIFHTKKVPGITCAVKWQQTGKRLTHVIAADVLLEEIFDTITGIDVSPNGKTILLNGNGHVFSKETGQRMSGLHNRFFFPADELADPLVKDACHSWERNEKPAREPLEFNSAGKVYWAEFRLLETNTRNFWIGVVVPEADFFTEIRSRQTGMITASLAALLVGLAFAGVVVRRYSKRLKVRSQPRVDWENFENDVVSLIRSGESSTLEFKSTMRMNLKTGKSGKEIELAWLKAIAGFLNTDGGILLIGVDDRGKIVGVAADEFEDEDKIRLHFKNLVRQHIGLEFSEFFKLNIQTFEGKIILIVECERSPDPVFVQNKTEEIFYIRSGPASVPLSTSKVLKYLQNRN
jgi:hypothetical protein